MNQTIISKIFKRTIETFEPIIEPKESKDSENYYRSKTFNIFTLVSLLITALNTIVRFFEVIFNQNKITNETLFITSTILLVLISTLFLIGRSNYYSLGLYAFPFIPLIGIWFFYPIYKNNFSAANSIELFSINPTLILILGLIVAGLLLSIRELLIFTFLSILDMVLFYGLTIQSSNAWIIPRLLALLLIASFMIINTYFRLLTFRFLNESNKKLTKEVEINQRNLIEERIILYTLISNLKEGVLILDKQNTPVIVNHNFTKFYELITETEFNMNGIVEKYADKKDPFFRFLTKTNNNESISEIIEIENKFFLFIGNHIKANSDSQNLGLMVEIHDITDLKVVDMLERNFRKVIMHELRTPTTSLQLSISNLVKYWDKIQEDDKRKLLKSMESQTNKFTDIITKISNLTELESKETIEKTNIDFLAFLDIFKSQLEMKNGLSTFKIEKSFENNFLLNIDIPLILQAIKEIIDNAKKFSQSNSEITIKFNQEIDNLII